MDLNVRFFAEKLSQFMQTTNDLEKNRNPDDLDLAFCKLVAMSREARGLVFHCLVLQSEGCLDEDGKKGSLDFRAEWTRRQMGRCLFSKYEDLPYFSSINNPGGIEETYKGKIASLATMVIEKKLSPNAEPLKEAAKLLVDEWPGQAARAAAEHPRPGTPPGLKLVDLRPSAGTIPAGTPSSAGDSALPTEILVKSMELESRPIPDNMDPSRVACDECMRKWKTSYLTEPKEFSQDREAVQEAIQAMRDNAAIYRLHLSNLKGLVGQEDKSGKSISDGLRKQLSNMDLRPQIPFKHIIIEGETGTGKSEVARMLARVFRHELGDKGKDGLPATSGPDLGEINCSAIVPTLASTILFGCKKGFYSGGDKTDVESRGLLLDSYLNAAPLFLDEIAEMPLDTKGWAMLNLYLTDGKINRGGEEAMPLYIPMPIIAATNRDIEECIRMGEFRRDLQRRFAIRIRLDPLRDNRNFLVRSIDRLMNNPTINPLHSYHVGDNDNIKGEARLAVGKVTQPALEKLSRQLYPYNIRDLQETLRASCRKAINSPRHAGGGGLPAGGIELDEGDVEYVTEAPAEYTDVAVALYFRKNAAGETELLLLYNDDWERNFFLCARFDNLGGVRVPAQALEIKIRKWLERSEQCQLDLTALVLRDGSDEKEYLCSGEYSKHYLRQKDYRYFFYLLEPRENPEIFQKALAKSEHSRLVGWVSAKDMKRDKIGGRAEPFNLVSPQIKSLLGEVARRLDQDLNKEIHDKVIGALRGLDVTD